MKREPDPVIALRLPASLVAAIDARAVKQDVSRSVVIRRVLTDVLGADVPKPAPPPAKPAKAKAVAPAPPKTQHAIGRRPPPPASTPRPKANDGDRCPHCGALYVMVGYTHRCNRSKP